DRHRAAAQRVRQGAQDRAARTRRRRLRRGCVSLTEEEQQRYRAAFRDQMTRTPYIGGLRILIEEWSPDGVRLRLPFDEHLTNDGHAYHGGVVASLVDTSGAAAVWAGHDYDKGMRAATVSMTVNCTGAARDTDLLAGA